MVIMVLLFLLTQTTYSSEKDASLSKRSRTEAQADPLLTVLGDSEFQKLCEDYKIEELFHRRRVAEEILSPENYEATRYHKLFRDIDQVRDGRFGLFPPLYASFNKEIKFLKKKFKRLQSLGATTQSTYPPQLSANDITRLFFEKHSITNSAYQNYLKEIIAEEVINETTIPNIAEQIELDLNETQLFQFMQDLQKLQLSYLPNSVIVSSPAETQLSFDTAVIIPVPQAQPFKGISFPLPTTNPPPKPKSMDSKTYLEMIFNTYNFPEDLRKTLRDRIISHNVLRPYEITNLLKVYHPSAVPLTPLLSKLHRNWTNNQSWHAYQDRKKAAEALFSLQDAPAD